MFLKLLTLQKYVSVFNPPIDVLNVIVSKINSCLNNNVDVESSLRILNMFGKINLHIRTIRKKLPVALFAPLYKTS